MSVCGLQHGLTGELLDRVSSRVIFVGLFRYTAYSASPMDWKTCAHMT